MNQATGKTTPCQRLDDYLDGELVGDQRRAFAEHTATCDACRRAVAETARLYDLVRAATVDAPAPNRQVEPAARSSRRWLAAALLATAATVGGVWLATAWRAADQPGRAAAPEAPPAPREPSAESPPAEVVPQVAESPQPRSRPTVQVTPSDDYLAVVHPSAHEQVTIVWTYPVVRGGT